MTFNSFVFWIFFLIVIGMLRILSHRGQNILLVVASYVFYGAWDYRFLSLIFISTIVDFYVGQKIGQSVDRSARKRWCILSIIVNLGILGFFKYYNFFVENAAIGLKALGLDVDPFTLNIVLPVGISFYTFQTMSYTIDVYRGVTKPTRNFVDFALYVSFFPQLVAGPIERSSHLLPQIANPRTVSAKDFSSGLYLVVSGLFMKIVVADNMATIVNAIYGTDTAELSGADYLVATYCFALQIYGDFYGYSAIARGVARWMGVDLMTNFRMPYFATNPSQFWQRWHISLSSWLRDYLYIPLGGNRKGPGRTYRNLMLTMFLGGIWHGVGWTFILWGTFHGALLCFYRKFVPERPADSPPSLLRRIFLALFFFHLVCIGWLFFRAESLPHAMAILTDIFTDFRPSALAAYVLGAIGYFFGPFLILELWLEKRQDLMALTKVSWKWRALAYSYAAIMIIEFPPIVTSEFIYFQF